jgi:hypothetical protein
MLSYVKKKKDHYGRRDHQAVEPDVRDALWKLQARGVEKNPSKGIEPWRIAHVKHAKIHFPRVASELEDNETKALPEEPEQPEDLNDMGAVEIYKLNVKRWHRIVVEIAEQKIEV